MRKYQGKLAAQKQPDPLKGFLWKSENPHWHPGIYEGISEAEAKRQVGTASEAKCMGFNLPKDQSVASLIPLVQEPEDESA